LQGAAPWVARTSSQVERVEPGAHCAGVAGHEVAAVEVAVARGLGGVQSAPVALHHCPNGVRSELDGLSGQALVGGVEELEKA